MRNLFFSACILLALAGPALAKSLPEEYGRVVINNYSEEAGLSPVVFDHWIHRALYTCRLCHVDIGFAMQPGGTDIKAESNMAGYHCGSCHDGKTTYDGKVIFAACDSDYKPEEKKRCDRCHSEGRSMKRDFEFAAFTKDFPKEGLGNGINWELAEEKGAIKPVDFLEGISLKRPGLKPQEDFSIKSRGTWMFDVIFSHKKHAKWNGCEVCHPAIFPTVEKGTLKYSMFDIYDGEYCGVCHGKVAFPLIECQRCHTNPVQ